MPPPLTSSIIHRSTASGPGHSDQHPSGLSSEDFDLWEHAALLYHSYEWQEAIDVFRYLTRQIQAPEPRTLCLLNAGIIQARLGDYAHAARTIEAAAECNDSVALYPLTLYLLGIMEWELSNVIKAEASLQVCLTYLFGNDISYAAYGIDFELKCENVRRQLDTAQSILHLGSGQDIKVVASQILPAECIFEAPSRSGVSMAATNDIHHASMIDSLLVSKLAARHTSPNLRKVEGTPKSMTKPHEGVGRMLKKPSNLSDSITMKAKPYDIMGHALRKFASFSGSGTTVVEPLDRVATSSAGPEYHTSWRRRPSTPYTPRDARGEYEAGRGVDRFLRRYILAQPPLPEPRTEGTRASPTKELAKFIKTCGRGFSGGGPLVTLGNLELRSPTAVKQDVQVPSLHDSGSIDQSTETKTSQRASIRAIVQGSPESHSSVYTSHDIEESRVRSESADIVSSHLANRSLDEHRRLDNEVLDLLLPTVYLPARKAQERGTSEPPKEPIQLLTYDESRPLGHYFEGIHSAASSTSELYRDSMKTLDRRDLAQTEAMNLLEGLPGVPRNAPLKPRGKDIAQKPLPPNPEVSRFNSIVGEEEAQVRVPSSQIFDYYLRNM